jgi:hypothetical protein
MKTISRTWVFAFLVLAGLVPIGALSACSDDDDGSSANGDGDGRNSPEETGSVCESDDECFADLEIEGEAMCLDRVRDGYCTHSCESDDDCCAVDGECLTDFAQVCSPFESAGTMMCFLSCEDEDVEAADADDDQAFCQTGAGSDFICRSSGGGSNNRKVCVPGDCDLGATCGEDADCNGDLECLTGFAGGYCGQSGCEENADCPNGSSCVVRAGGNVCLKDCARDSDCGFCRAEALRGTCSDDAEFAESGDSVCVPPAR